MSLENEPERVESELETVVECGNNNNSNNNNNISNKNDSNTESLARGEDENDVNQSNATKSPPQSPIWAQKSFAQTLKANLKTTPSASFSKNGTVPILSVSPTQSQRVPPTDNTKGSTNTSMTSPASSNGSSSNNSTLLQRRARKISRKKNMSPSSSDADSSSAFVLDKLHKSLPTSPVSSSPPPTTVATTTVALNTPVSTYSSTSVPIPTDEVADKTSVETDGNEHVASPFNSGNSYSSGYNNNNNSNNNNNNGNYGNGNSYLSNNRYPKKKWRYQRTSADYPHSAVMEAASYANVPVFADMNYYAKMQIEYYFSVENLCRDIYLRQKMDDEGYVPVDVLAEFNRLKAIGCTAEMIEMAVRDSVVVEVCNRKIRKQNDWNLWLLPKAVEKSSD